MTSHHKSFWLLGWVTTLYEDGQIRNSSVFTEFHLYNSTATSNDESEYETLPERISWNEERSGRKEEQIRKVPRSCLILPQTCAVS